MLRDLSDRATGARIDLEAWAEGENIDFDPVVRGELTRFTQPIGRAGSDIDLQILQAAAAGNLHSLRDSNSRIQTSPDAKERITRTFLAAISESTDEALAVLLESNLVDLNAEDDINERNCLHEAAIHGRNLVLERGLTHGVDLARVDVYGRIPLHYACLKGRAAMVETLIQAGPRTVDFVDHDRFTPLIHSLVRNKLSCAEILVSQHVRIEPSSESDHVPLNLACQHGSFEAAALLLEKGAGLLPDAEGLYPQHHVARSNRDPNLLLLLSKHGADLDQKDRLYQWTPLLHAASEGSVSCLRHLLENGVDIGALDEKGLSAMYYATWEGHLQCMSLLWGEHQRRGLHVSVDKISNQSLGKTKRLETTIDATPTRPPAEADGIPDLSLPPPIIPLRRYGHNFLDTKTFISINFYHGAKSITFFNEGRYSAARLTISSKMSDLIPRSIMLPIQEDSRVVAFQADILESFAVEFEIFPTFGSKVIAKTVALPDVFRAVESSSGHCCLPLFDPRLRAIGQISFSFQVIKPYSGQPLEIANFATYWKATSAIENENVTLITGSSLSGRYVQVPVQLTRDGVAIIYPHYQVNVHGLQIPISQLSLAELTGLRSPSQTNEYLLQRIALLTPDELPILYELIVSSLLPLKDVLAQFPASIRINLSIQYPTPTEEIASAVGPIVDINTFTDKILAVVFDHARSARVADPNFMRSIVFSSHNRNICTAMNWKQPNCT